MGRRVLRTGLAVGSPGADGGSVEVHLMRDGEPTQVRVRPPDPQPDDQFGASIAEVAHHEGEQDTSTCSQLVVSAAFLYRWDSGANAFTLVKELTQGEDGVPGQARAGANFGRSLAAPYHEAAIGSVVTPLYVGAPKVPGTAEAGDAFGQAVAATHNGVLAGTPGENDGSGGFIRWRENDRGDAKFVTQAKTAGFNQDEPGVAGHPEAGDRFGSSFGSFGPGPSHLVVGAPGEAIGSAEDAGVVQALARGQAWHQNTAGVAGAVENGDEFGKTIGNALVPMTGEREDGWLSRVVVGLPGGSGTAYGYFSAEPGDRFGSAIGKTN